MNERITQILDEVDWDYYEEEVEPDPYFYVMGLDPGGTTGVALLRINVEEEDAKPELVYLHQIPDGYDGFKDWFYGAQPSSNTQFVSEKWKERNIKGADRTPQYIEGGMLWAWGDHTVWQYPDQKELIPDQWLKDNNLWTEGKRHQMDALKHAFAYLRNNGNSATLESLSGHGDGEPMAEPGAGDRAQLSEQDGSGEDGEGTEAGEAAANFEEMMQQIAEVKEVMDKLAEGAKSAGENMNGFMDNFDVKTEGTRKKRELNGAFTGFDSEGADEVASVLFED